MTLLLVAGCEEGVQPLNPTAEPPELPLIACTKDTDCRINQFCSSGGCISIAWRGYW